MVALGMSICMPKQVMTSEGGVFHPNSWEGPSPVIS